MSMGRTCACGHRLFMPADPAVPDDLVFYEWAILEAGHEHHAHPEQYSKRCDLARRIRRRLPALPGREDNKVYEEALERYCVEMSALIDSALAAMSVEPGVRGWYTLECTGRADGFPMVGRWGHTVTETILSCLVWWPDVVVTRGYLDEGSEAYHRIKREHDAGERERAAAERKVAREVERQRVAAEREDAAMHDGLLSLLGGDW